MKSTTNSWREEMLLWAETKGADELNNPTIFQAMLKKDIVVMTNNFYTKVQILTEQIPKLVTYLAELPPMPFRLGSDFMI